MYFSIAAIIDFAKASRQNLAFSNRVSIGQASSRITDYTNCAKPRALPANLKDDTTSQRFAKPKEPFFATAPARMLTLTTINN
jgi:hypothetical protein